MTDDQPLIEVDHASKKFCRSLKRSLWYGVRDISRELLGRDAHGDLLRPREFWAVTDVSFEIRRGECVGLIGRNGAGKSTLLKMLNGLVKPDMGRITMRGRVGALIELGTGFNPILTGRENIYNNAAILGMRKRDVDSQLDEIIEFAGIGDTLDTPVRSYSAGMRVRLGFAVAAQLQPDVLLIDEVLAVGDIGFRVKCMNRISQLLPTTAVVLVSHNMPHVSRICNRVIVIEGSQVRSDTGDVAMGIDCYHSLVETLHRNDLVVCGAELRDVQLRTQSSTWKSAQDCAVGFGEDLLIRLNLNISPRVRRFDLRLMIISEEIPLVDSYSGVDGSQFVNHGSGDEHIEVRLPRLQLNTGNYGITVIVRDATRANTILCRVANAARFRAQSPYSSWCKTIVQGEWTQSISGAAVECAGHEPETK